MLKRGQCLNKFMVLVLLLLQRVVLFFSGRGLAFWVAPLTEEP
jgi:hypothetical protein